MPFDKNGREYHPSCLLCGIEKELTESILCDECIDRFDAVQEYSLQSQIEELEE